MGLHLKRDVLFRIASLEQVFFYGLTLPLSAIDWYGGAHRRVLLMKVMDGS